MKLFQFLLEKIISRLHHTLQLSKHLSKESVTQLTSLMSCLWTWPIWGSTSQSKTWWQWPETDKCKPLCQHYIATTLWRFWEMITVWNILALHHWSKWWWSSWGKLLFCKYTHTYRDTAAVTHRTWRWAWSTGKSQTRQGLIKEKRQGKREL